MVRGILALSSSQDHAERELVEHEQDGVLFASQNTAQTLTIVDYRAHPTSSTARRTHIHGMAHLPLLVLGEWLTLKGPVGNVVEAGIGHPGNGPTGQRYISGLDGSRELARDAEVDRHIGQPPAEGMSLLSSLCGQGDLPARIAISEGPAAVGTLAMTRKDQRANGSAPFKVFSRL